MSTVSQLPTELTVVARVVDRNLEGEKRYRTAFDFRITVK